ncbi:MAG: hypothetical protein WBA12_10255 [Catalinimonas sp.]
MNFVDKPGVVRYDTYEQVWTVVSEGDESVFIQEVGILCSPPEGSHHDGQPVVFSGAGRNRVRSREMYPGGVDCPIGPYQYYFRSLQAHVRRLEALI